MRFIKISSLLSVFIIGLVLGWNTIYVSEQERDIALFNAIYISGPINVFVEEGEKAKVIVRADNNILDKVITEVIDGELRIYTKSDIRHERVLDVYVNYQSLNSIYASGPSTITGRSVLKTSKLKIRASVSAEVKLQMKVDSLSLIINNAANVQLAGSTTNFNLLITDVGDLMAYNLKSQHCIANLNTGQQNPGIARIHVEKTLNVTIKGPRFLNYKGNAEITKQTIEGNGEIVKY